MITIFDSVALKIKIGSFSHQITMKFSLKTKLFYKKCISKENQDQSLD